MNNSGISHPFFSSRFMGKMKFSAFFNHGMEVRSDSNTQPKLRETSHHQIPHHHPWFSQKFPKVPPTVPWWPSQPIIISSLKGEVDGDDMMVSLGAASNIGGFNQKEFAKNLHLSLIPSSGATCRLLSTPVGRWYQHGQQRVEQYFASFTRGFPLIFFVQV